MERKFIFASLLLLAPVFGQTRVDVSTQGKNIDFSNIPLVRPFRTGTVLPVTCVQGEMFFKTDASAGANSYGCVTAGTWALQGQDTGTSLQVLRTNASTLTIGPGCSVPEPCNVRVGATTYSFVAPATVTAQSGSGLILLYVTSSGAITAGVATAGSPSIGCTGCNGASLITQFPTDSIPLATWNVTSAVLDSAGSDERAQLSAGRTLTAGPNIVLTESGSNVTISATIANPADPTQDPGPTPTGGGLDPLDMTAFDQSYVFAEFGYSHGSPWAYNGSCGGGAAVVNIAGEPGGLGWAVTSNLCFVYYPGGNGNLYPFGDFISGSSPKNYTLVARYARGNGADTGSGDHYIGWSDSNDGTMANFVGFRYRSSLNAWACTIRAGGADVTVSTIPGALDGSVHTFKVTNGGTANTATCTIDATSRTVSAQIPAVSWFGVMGVNAGPVSGFFTTIEARIHISGISR